MIKHHVSRLRRIAGIPSGLALATLATFYLLINALTFESAEVDWHHLDSRPPARIGGVLRGAQALAPGGCRRPIAGRLTRWPGVIDLRDPPGPPLADRTCLLPAALTKAVRPGRRGA
jgi:hypothetical protein